MEGGTRSPNWPGVDAALRGEHHLVAPALETASEQSLACSAAIPVGGVEEGHADVERTSNGLDRVVFVDAAHPKVPKQILETSRSVFPILV